MTQLARSDLHQAPEHDGFTSPARRQAGNGCAIMPIKDNVDIMLGYQKTAVDCLTRGVIRAPIRAASWDGHGR